MGFIMSLSMDFPTVQHFPALPHKGHDCQGVRVKGWREIYWTKHVCFDFLYNFSETFIILQRIQQSIFINLYKVKAKVTLVQALRLCTGRTAHRGCRGIALLFNDHGTKRGWGVSVTPLPLFTHGKNPVPVAQEAGWAPGPAWTGAENFAPTGIRFPDRPARSQSLYPATLPAHINVHGSLYKVSVISVRFLKIECFQQILKK
jgi:hypothetical protein